MALDGVALAFDYGGRRIGVAVGQAITGTATPLAVVGNGHQGPNWIEIDRLIKSWMPTALVVGLPITETGEDQPMTHASRAFGVELAKRYQLPVHHQDERFSSRESEAEFKRLRQQGMARKKDAAMLDAAAAKRILERWLSGVGGSVA